LHERLGQRPAFSTSDEAVNIIHRGVSFVLSGKTIHAWGALEKRVDRNTKNTRDLLQSAGTNAVDTFFVFLDLLECDAKPCFVLPAMEDKQIAPRSIVTERGANGNSTRSGRYDCDGRREADRSQKQPTKRVTEGA
jgi:hypothetical protein